MPAVSAERPGLSLVAKFSSLLDSFLSDAAVAKPTPTIEPRLKKSNFNNLSARMTAFVSGHGSHEQSLETDESARTMPRTQQLAVVETAARDLFDRLIATTTIDAPDFVTVWNLFDILLILSDDGQCDPALLFWLIEELLDSQTIEGCRKVFDYLESRREGITAKHFKQKQLVILRSCNELLRRLSRAEDTAFCGRVFIFLFQSFPLGDRSSVNLRGEYHVENVTSFEEPARLNGEQMESKMDVDTPAGTPKSTADAKGGSGRGVSVSTSNAQKPFDADTLYPIFWSLQESFTQPLKLFDAKHFTQFKTNLDATMKAFQSIHSGESPPKSSDILRKNLKRKRESGDLEPAPVAFNPKYLTSKDLFVLEISDLTFRRHVLVQALIITDFLLSLTPSAKEKLTAANSSNKSVVYNDQLSDQDTKWATEMRNTISEYLKRGYDGPYFFRMVETVLSRDKNWVFWKMASCPPIERQPVSGKMFNEARAAVQRTATSKRLRPTPIGSVLFDFLNNDENDDDETSLQQLQSSERYRLPDLDTFQRKIADDDFEIQMPTNEQTKAAAIAGKSSKAWRALRIAARSRLAVFDKVDDSRKVDVIFQEPPGEDAPNGDDNGQQPAPDSEMPKDRTPIILAGSDGVGVSALVEQLLEQHKGVFVTAVRHTDREPADGEIKGKSFHFVTTQEFNQLRDGDRLIEYGTRDGTQYGTSGKVIDAIISSGRVPIIKLDMEAAQFAKDMDFSARYILLKGTDQDSTPSEPDIFDHIVDNFRQDDMQNTAKTFSSYIFGKENGQERPTAVMENGGAHSDEKVNGAP